MAIFNSYVKLPEGRYEVFFGLRMVSGTFFKHVIADMKIHYVYDMITIDYTYT